MKKLITISLLSCLVFIAGCNKQQFGTSTGAILGGYAGSQIGGGSGQLVATAAGTLIGSMIGGSIGSRMDELDYMKTNRALESSRTGYSTNWNNPDTGAYYSVTPTQTYETSQGGPCREYRTEATIDGRHETLYGTACRQTNGQWQAIN